MFENRDDAAKVSFLGFREKGETSLFKSTMINYQALGEPVPIDYVIDRYLEFFKTANKVPCLPREIEDKILKQHLK